MYHYKGVGRRKKTHQRVAMNRWWWWRADGSRGNHQRVARTRWWSVEAAEVVGGGREVAKVVEGRKDPPTSRDDPLVVFGGGMEVGWRCQRWWWLVERW
jgi:hypothetical protein